MSMVYLRLWCGIILMLDLLYVLLNTRVLQNSLQGAVGSWSLILFGRSWLEVHVPVYRSLVHMPFLFKSSFNVPEII